MARNRSELITEVTAGGRNFWSAHDQGRLAFHSGVAFKDNPHRLPTPGYFHAHMACWERGWKQEADASRERARQVGCCVQQPRAGHVGENWEG